MACRIRVPVSPSRVGSYRRILADIESKHREAKIDELLNQHGFPVLANALFESTELIDIHDGLAGIDEDIAASLRKFAQGCPLLTGECRTGNNVGRNIGFELDIAASFRRLGFPIKLQPPADLWITSQDNPIAVECKRPFSYDALGANMEKAFSQLRQRYRTHASPSQVRGVAALSASKMENDGSLMLQAANATDLNITIRRLSDQFVARTHESWDKARDRRTIGIVVQLRAPSRIEDVNLFVVVRHFTWIGLAQTSEDQQLFRRLANAFTSPEEKLGENVRSDRRDDR
jgi:hypothetical protein